MVWLFREVESGALCVLGAGSSLLARPFDFRPGIPALPTKGVYPVLRVTCYCPKCTDVIVVALYPGWPEADWAQAVPSRLFCHACKLGFGEKEVPALVQWRERDGVHVQHRLSPYLLAHMERFKDVIPSAVRQSVKAVFAGGG